MDSGNETLVEAFSRKILRNVVADSEKLTEVASLFIRRKYPRKALLLTTGEKWDKIFYIHQGLVRLFYAAAEGREFNKGFYCEGQLIWPVAPSVRRKDSLFSIAALENLTVSVCSFALFHSWLEQRGYWEKFALPYAEAFAERLFMREYEFLLNSAAERYRNFCIEYPGLVRRIPDYHLASYLGITNVSLSRIKNTADFNVC
jgi:CRP/FNR family transcriptional regulator, anaerobic regulatory protein